MKINKKLFLLSSGLIAITTPIIIVSCDANGVDNQSEDSSKTKNKHQQHNNQQTPETNLPSQPGQEQPRQSQPSNPETNPKTEIQNEPQQPEKTPTPESNPKTEIQNEPQQPKPSNPETNPKTEIQNEPQQPKPSTPESNPKTEIQNGTKQPKPSTPESNPQTPPQNKPDNKGSDKTNPGLVQDSNKEKENKEIADLKTRLTEFITTLEDSAKVLDDQFKKSVISLITQAKTVLSLSNSTKDNIQTNIDAITKVIHDKKQELQKQTTSLINKANEVKNKYMEILTQDDVNFEKFKMLISDVEKSAFLPNTTIVKLVEFVKGIEKGTKEFEKTISPNLILLNAFLNKIKGKIEEKNLYVQNIINYIKTRKDSELSEVEEILKKIEDDLLVFQANPNNAKEQYIPYLAAKDISLGLSINGVRLSIVFLDFMLQNTQNWQNFKSIFDDNKKEFKLKITFTDSKKLEKEVVVAKKDWKYNSPEGNQLFDLTTDIPINGNFTNGETYKISKIILEPENKEIFRFFDANEGSNTPSNHSITIIQLPDNF